MISTLAGVTGITVTFTSGNATAPICSTEPYIIQFEFTQQFGPQPPLVPFANAGRFTLSTISVTLPYQHPLCIPSQPTHSIHPPNSHSQHTLSTHPVNPPYQPLPLNPPTQPTLSTYPINTPSHRSLIPLDGNFSHDPGW